MQARPKFHFLTSNIIDVLPVIGVSGIVKIGSVKTNVHILDGEFYCDTVACPTHLWFKGRVVKDMV